MRQAALDLLEAVKYGILESADGPLNHLNRALNLPNSAEEMAAALTILQEARISMYSHRAHLVHELQQMERECLYLSRKENSGASWEVAA